jgi:hypothetical protein
MAFLEWTDSTAKLAGVAYNHHIYIDGYRYRGRPLGHWADGDAAVWTLGGLWRDLAGGQALAVLRYGSLNDAAASPTWPTSRLVNASAQWRTLLMPALRLSLAVDYLSLSGTAMPRDDTQLRVQLEAWWP